MILVGISTTDTEEDISRLSKKLLSLRVFEDMTQSANTTTKFTGKPWAKSIIDIQGEILSVSQFTLYGTIKKVQNQIFIELQRDITPLNYTRNC